MASQLSPSLVSCELNLTRHTAMFLLLYPPAPQQLDESVRRPLHGDSAGISICFVKYN